MSLKFNVFSLPKFYGCFNVLSNIDCMEGSLALKVEDPGRKAPSLHNHATSVRQVSLTVVLDLQVGHLTGVQRPWQLRSQREIGVVEVYSELALLVEGVLEVDADRLGSWSALDGSLRLRSLGLTKEEAGVLHALGAGELEHSAAVANRERLVADVERHFNALVVLSSSSWHLGDVSLEVASARPVNPLDLDRVVGLLLEEVDELKCLHLVLPKGALEGK